MQSCVRDHTARPGPRHMTPPITTRPRTSRKTRIPYSTRGPTRSVSRRRRRGRDGFAGAGAISSLGLAAATLTDARRRLIIHFPDQSARTHCAPFTGTAWTLNAWTIHAAREGAWQVNRALMRPQRLRCIPPPPPSGLPPPWWDGRPARCLPRVRRSLRPARSEDRPVGLAGGAPVA